MHFSDLQNKYYKSLSWAENLNKLFIVLGRKFKFSAQDSDVEYLCWQRKNSPVSSDLKPPLASVFSYHERMFDMVGTNILPQYSLHSSINFYRVSV